MPKLEGGLERRPQYGPGVEPLVGDLPEAEILSVVKLKYLKNLLNKLCQQVIEIKSTLLL